MKEKNNQRQITDSVPAELKYMAKCILGEPITSVELSDEQMDSLYGLSIIYYRFYSILSNRSPTIISNLKDEWISLYFISLCKYTLGLIRNKFTSGIQLPKNQIITLNGEQLLIDSTNELVNLKELLINY